ncbi:hypothetical protein EDD85DRAFT_958780 [Armillaria nabsnona]|nr:hypothetical protein EDD85DRAFT_958780 [Armillaria nabsnona]
MSMHLAVLTTVTLRLYDSIEAESPLSLPMTAVPAFLHGHDGYNLFLNDLEQLKVTYNFQMNSLMSCQANNACRSSAINTLQM